MHNILFNILNNTNPEQAQGILNPTNELKLLSGNEWFFVILLPLMIIFVISFCVGFERQNVGKAAGISAHVLVGIAATSLAIMQRLMFKHLAMNGSIDGSGGQRVIAQVVAGVSFVGAGVVMKHERTVRGLTTATTIWSIAMIGLILGSGYLIVGSISGAIMLTFMIIRDLSRHINPFVPGKERTLIIKKYLHNKDKITKTDTLTPEEVTDQEEENKAFL